MPRDSSNMGRGIATLSTYSPGNHEPARPSFRWQVDFEARLPGLLRVVDLIGITAVGLGIAHFFASDGEALLVHPLAVVLGATATVNILHLANAYSMNSIARLPVQLTKTAIAWSGAFLGVVTISSAPGDGSEFWGCWAIVWFATALLLLSATRWVASRRLQRWRREGRSIRHVAVLGTGQEAFALERRLKEQSDKVHVVGVFVEGDVPTGTGRVVGDGERLASLANAGRVDEVLIALPWKSPGALNHTLSRFAASQVEVRIDPGMQEIDCTPTELRLIGGVPTLTVQGRPLSGWDAPLKRLEDVVLASILVVVLSPLLLAISLLIKMDSRGPVLFRQERSGFDNRQILVFKFRSMHHDPNPDPNVPQTRRNDPRVTRIGGFLRRTSLDELPQLLNVLRGEMSLVGPRPHASIHNEKYARLIDGYLGRHRVKPGITGWAQVNGLRGGIDSIEEMKRRLEHDRYYVANWSLLLDIKILLMTFPAVLRGTNAY
jgi:Undecaprenyl-phosphate glucose phosphotransferase